MRLQRGLLSGFLFCLVLPSMGWAAIRYVSTTGSDSNSCAASTSTSTPKRNIMGAQGGLACMSAGDTLYLRGGSYQEAINSQAQTIPVGTSEGARITIASYSGESATLNPSGTTVVNFGLSSIQYITFDRIVLDWANLNATDCDNPEGHVLFGVTNDAHHIRFQNGEMKNGRGPHVQFYASGNHTPFSYSSFNQVLNSHIHDATCSYGFYINQRDVLLDGNEIYNNAGYGIQAYGGDYDVNTNNNLIIRNNKIHGNGYGRGYGAITLNHGTNIQVYNNLIYNNNRGIEVSGGQPSNQVKLWNNTMVGNGSMAVQIGSGATNWLVQNNIFDNNSGAGGSGSIVDGGTGTTLTPNQCSSPGTGCTPALVGNPGFANSAGGDFRIATAGSPANNTALNLSVAFTTDAEGFTRPASGNWTMGALEFNPSPFTPLGTIAKYTFEEGSGTSAADSSGQGNTCTLTSAAWGAGIIGSFSFAPTGTQSCSATMPTGIRPTTQAGLSVWFNATTTPAEGSILAALPGDALAIYVYPPPDGRPLCQVYDGTTFYEATGSASVLTGTNRHGSCSFKSGDGIRLRIDDAQVAFVAVTASLNYSLGGNFTVGRSSPNNAYHVIGRVDQVYAFDTEITAAMNTSLYNELVPPVGMSVAHMVWEAANVAPGSQIGTTDAPRTHVLTEPLAILYALRKSDPGSLTEYFPLCCIANTGAGFPPWSSCQILSNSFGSLGARYLADSAVTQGQAISARLPLDGFTAVSGKALENPIDTTSPYDASQRITIAQGQHAEERISVEFGSPLAAGHQLQCRPYRENLTSFGEANYANIQMLTFTVVQPPSSVIVGGNMQGGTRQ